MDTEKVNIHQVERNISTVLGAVLLLRSLTRDSLSGTLLAITLLYRGMSGHSSLYKMLGINTAGTSRQRQIETSDGVIELEHSITVERPAVELYQFWREPQYLSQIMYDLAEVTALSENRVLWRVRVPFARPLEWETQVVVDFPGQILRWESLEGAPLSNEGSVRFRPAPRDWGTETTLNLRFYPPADRLSSRMAKHLGIAGHMLAEKALRRFKSLAETGEIPTLERNPSARISAHTH